MHFFHHTSSEYHAQGEAYAVFAAVEDQVVGAGLSVGIGGSEVAADVVQSGFETDVEDDVADADAEACHSAEDEWPDGLVDVGLGEALEEMAASPGKDEVDLRAGKAGKPVGSLLLHVVAVVERHLQPDDFGADGGDVRRGGVGAPLGCREEDGVAADAVGNLCLQIVPADVEAGKARVTQADFGLGSDVVNVGAADAERLDGIEGGAEAGRSTVVERRATYVLPSLRMHHAWTYQQQDDD